MTSLSTPTNSQTRPLLQIRGLSVSFPAAEGRVRAVDDVSLTVYPGQTVAIVGESGSGKSLAALSVLRLLPPRAAAVDSGRVLLATEQGTINVLEQSEARMRAIRGGQVAMIFQEPMTSLNPVFTIGEQIVEAVRLHQAASKSQARDAAIAALREVGIAEPARRLADYPHQFSGGMRQRVMIAMALACRPRLLLADEPTTALDVTVQAQVLSLLRELRGRRRMGLLLITHAMGVVAEQADVVCVMYAGRVVEYASIQALFDHPLHPYTRGLLASIPRLRDRRERLTTIRQILDDPAQFQGADLGDGRQPWWPERDSGPSALREVRRGHWVRVCGSVEGAPCREPDLAPAECEGVAACEC